MADTHSRVSGGVHSRRPCALWLAGMEVYVAKQISCIYPTSLHGEKGLKMKVKDLSGKIGARTKGSVEIRRGTERLAQTTFHTLCFDQMIVQEYLGMTITFFNIETAEKGDVRMIIQVK